MQGINIVFRDVVTLALAGFVAIAIILLAHVNPPENAQDDAKQPGTLAVQIRWPDDVNADVDLWVKAPGQAPVGYSRKSGKIFDLLRDDLGHLGDVLGLNYESAYSRGIPDGEWAVNIHMYRFEAAEYPVVVKALVSARVGQGGVRNLFAKEVSLLRFGHEITVIRFSTQAGKLVAGSEHDLPVRLREISD